LLLVAACSGKSTIDCATNADCLQGRIGGTCRPSPAGEQSWCAFPDPGCLGTGERWGVASGDGLAGNCREPLAVDAGTTDGGPIDPGPPTSFAFRFGGVGSDGISRALPVSDGTLMVVGSFTGTLRLGNDVILASAGEADLFIARLRRDGAPVWIHQFGGTANERVVDAAVDGNDAITVVGVFRGDTDLGGGTSTSQADDLFIMKVDATGALVWDHEHGGIEDDNAAGLAMTPDGDAIVYGSFSNLIDLGDGTQHSAGSTDAFLVRYAGVDGSVVWSERFGGAGSEESLGIASVGPSVVVSGRAGGDSNLGGGAVSFPKTGGFVAVYSTANGSYSWAHTVQAESLLGPVYIDHVALLHDGSVVACARFQGETDFGAGTLHPGDGEFLGRYRVGGTLEWQRQLASANGSASCGALAVGVDDSVFLTGTFGGTMDFGTVQLSSTEVNHGDPFLASFSLGNEPLGALALHSPGDENVGGLVAAPEVIMTGSFGGDLLLDDGTTLTSVGASDSFVVGRVFP
jgi:hypothetical protein